MNLPDFPHLPTRPGPAHPRAGQGPDSVRIRTVGRAAAGFTLIEVMITVAIVGILVATVLTIFVLPAGYALFFGRDKKGGETPVEVEDDKPVEISNVYVLPQAAE